MQVHPLHEVRGVIRFFSFVLGFPITVESENTDKFKFCIVQLAKFIAAILIKVKKEEWN